MWEMLNSLKTSSTLVWKAVGMGHLLTSKLFNQGAAFRGNAWYATGSSSASLLLPWSMRCIDSYKTSFPHKGGTYYYVSSSKVWWDTSALEDSGQWPFRGPCWTSRWQQQEDYQHNVHRQIITVLDGRMVLCAGTFIPAWFVPRVTPQHHLDLTMIPCLSETSSGTFFWPTATLLRGP